MKKWKIVPQNSFKTLQKWDVKQNKSFYSIKFPNKNLKDYIMNKAEFIDAVAEKTGLSKKDTKIALEATLETISEALAKGDSVSFIGFGTFLVSPRAARTARVPGTGAEVKVPETKVAKFKVGKALKDSVK